MAEPSGSGIWLERQADHIEQVLQALSLPVRVSGGRIRERRVAYSLTPIAGTKPAAVLAAEPRLADALGAQTVHVLRERGRLALEIDGPPSDLRLLPLMAAIGDLAPATAVAGMAEDGRPLSIELTAQASQMMVIQGPKGSGKSELLRTLAISLALTSRPAQLGLAAIDSTGRELAVLESLPHMQLPLAITPPQCLTMLRRLSQPLQADEAAAQTLIVIDGGQGLPAKVRSQIDDRVAVSGGNGQLHWLITDPWPAAERAAAGAGGHRAQAGRRLHDFEWSSGSQHAVVSAAWLPLRDLATAVDLARRRPGAPLEPAVIRGYRPWL